MLDVNSLEPGSVVKRDIRGTYVFLAKYEDKFIFSPGVDLTERNLWTLSATGEVLTTVVIGANAYNLFGPLRVIGKTFKELQKGEKVLVDTKVNLAFRICVVQDIDLQKMTITCNGLETNIQSTEVYRTGY